MIADVDGHETMIENAITLLAVVCSGCVAALCLFRWQHCHGFRSSVYFVLGTFAGLVALMNLSALLADGISFVRTATLAYVGFATAILLPAARALGKLTYEKPHKTDGEDTAV